MKILQIILLAYKDQKQKKSKKYTKKNDWNVHSLQNRKIDGQTNRQTGKKAGSHSDNHTNRPSTFYFSFSKHTFFIFCNLLHSLICTRLHALILILAHKHSHREIDREIYHRFTRVIICQEQVVNYKRQCDK